MRAIGALVGGLFLLLVLMVVLQWTIAEHPAIFISGCLIFVCAAVFVGSRSSKAAAAKERAAAESLQAETR